MTTKQADSANLLNRERSFSDGLCAALWTAAWTRDASAAVDAVAGDQEIDFGDVPGDADVAGTVVVDTAGNKTVTGGAFDLGGGGLEGIFVLEGREGSGGCGRNVSVIGDPPSGVTLFDGMMGGGGVGLLVGPAPGQEVIDPLDRAVADAG